MFGIEIMIIDVIIYDVIKIILWIFLFNIVCCCRYLFLSNIEIMIVLKIIIDVRGINIVEIFVMMFVFFNCGFLF